MGHYLGILNEIKDLGQRCKDPKIGLKSSINTGTYSVRQCNNKDVNGYKDLGPRWV